MVKLEATEIAAHMPTKIPKSDAFPFMSPIGFDIRTTPITHHIIFPTSYLDIFSANKIKQNIHVKIGDVKVKVVAIEIGLICSVKNAKNSRYNSTNHPNPNHFPMLYFYGKYICT
jgi:hypothetical protein